MEFLRFCRRNGQVLSKNSKIFLKNGWSNLKKMLKKLKFMTVVRSVTDISRHPPSRREMSGNVGKRREMSGTFVGKSREMSGNVGDASGGGPVRRQC